MLKKVILVFSFIFISSFINAENSTFIKEIKNVLEYTKTNAIFSAEVSLPDDIQLKINCTTDEKGNRLIHEERYFTQRRIVTYLQNEKGRFYLSPSGTWIKDERKRIPQESDLFLNVLCDSLTVLCNDIVRWSATSDWYGKYQVQIITVELAQKQTPGIEKIIFTIDVNGKFLYSAKLVYPNNTKTEIYKFENISFTPTISRAMFSIPEDTQIISANSLKKIKKGLQPSRPSVFLPLINGLSKLVDSLTELVFSPWFSIILGTFGILLLIYGIYIKLRYRN